MLRFCRRRYEPIRIRKQIELLSLGNAAQINTPDVPAELSTIEKEITLKYWIRSAQMTDFPEEYSALHRGEQIARGSRLWQLFPIMDDSKILRVGGRLDNATLSEDQRRPMILSARNLLSYRLAEDAHIRLLHGGAQQCSQYLRNRFWIVAGRVLIKKIVRDCVKCCRYRGETITQLMAQLPEMRINPSRAFQHTGVDFAGPMQLKQGRNVIIKCYIAVFVCMKCKAVHLELVSDLTSEAFIAALNRFISLRAGSIEHMYSDNGTNFVGSKRIMSQAYELWNDRDVARHLSLNSIQLHFIVPSAAVKATKFHLRRIGGAHTFTYEELTTLLTKISACLNSRPLVPLSDDPTDILTLTPGHFITGQPTVTPLGPPLTSADINLLTSWQKIEKLQQEFWARWSKEYVLEQQRRNKWANLKKSVSVGNLVFIKDEITPPCNWLMARITEVFRGKDGLIRSVKLRTVGGELNRPITKICLLPSGPGNADGGASGIGLS